jgi:hypothetical protein
MMPTFIPLCFLLALVMNAVAETYTAGSSQVNVETTILDSNNSTRKCVTYVSGMPEKYTTACFTSSFTDGATFQGCTVQLDNDATKRCDSCDACTDFNEDVGFTLDCDSILPSITNINDQVSCTLLNDANIQKILTDGTIFDSTPFDFMMDVTNLVTDDSDKENSTKTNMKNTTSGGSCTAVAYSGGIATFVSVLLFSL